MVFNFLFFTIKIVKRKYSAKQLTRVREVEQFEQEFEKAKQRYLYTQRII